VKILLDIKDEKTPFMIEVLKNFKEVKVKHISDYKGRLKSIPAKGLLDEL